MRLDDRHGCNLCVFDSYVLMRWTRTLGDMYVVLRTVIGKAGEFNQNLQPPVYLRGGICNLFPHNPQNGGATKPSAKPRV
jgi:hypothetical protein